MKLIIKALNQNRRIRFFLLMNCSLKTKKIWINKINKMIMKRMIIKILQIFLKKYKNTKRLKSLAKPKGSSKLELKNLRKI